MYVNMYTYTHIHTYIHTYIHAYICVCTYAYIDIAHVYNCNIYRPITSYDFIRLDVTIYLYIYIYRYSDAFMYMMYRCIEGFGFYSKDGLGSRV